MSENSYKEFVINNHDQIKSISDYTYSNGYNLYFGKDMISPQHDVCFARLYSQIKEKENSVYYFLRLPYQKNEALNHMSADWIDYPSVLKDMINTVQGVYDMHIYRSGFKNIKIITFESKLKLHFDIDYSLIMILFCLLRGMDSEYFSYWKSHRNNIKYKPATTLYEYFYDLGIVTEGYTGHDVNDDVAEVFNSDSPMKEVCVKNFINILKKTMSDDKLITDKRYEEYFLKNCKNRRSYGYTMQTDCFNNISETTRHLIVEDRK